jgi:hypothetical protein
LKFQRNNPLAKSIAWEKALRRFLRLVCILMVVFGSFYFARGWPNKGIATILFEVASIFFGMFGLVVLWVTGLFSGNNNSKNN